MIQAINQEAHMRLKCAGEELRQIAKTACAEVHKTAQIVIQSDRSREQKECIGQLNDMLGTIRKKTDIDGITLMAGVALGYANAMWHLNLMSEKEMDDVAGVIETEAGNAICRVEMRSQCGVRPCRKQGE